MKVLIIGSSGFIGYNLKNYLKKKNIRILEATKSPKDKNILKIDILSQEQIENYIKNVDAVVNLAGVSGNVSSSLDPIKTFKTNTLGHLNLLEAVRKSNPKAIIIFASSRLEYGIPKSLPVSENVFTFPNTFYGASKFSATTFSIIYGKLYGLKIVVFRMSNPFGPTPKAPSKEYNLLNYFIYRISQGKRITIFGKGDQKRDYIFIEDVCEAFYKALFKKRAIGEVINIGSGRPTKLKDVVKLIIRLAGKGKVVYKDWPKDWKRVETGDFFFDITKAKKILKWRPRTTLKEGLKKTLEYFYGESYENL